MSELTGTAVLKRWTISEMPPWHLWVSLESIGTTSEEAEAFVHGQVPAERAFELKAKTDAAFRYLRDVKPAGVETWMTWRRAWS